MRNNVYDVYNKFLRYTLYVLLKTIIINTHNKMAYNLNRKGQIVYHPLSI